jgi:hypothetical protein
LPVALEAQLARLVEMVAQDPQQLQVRQTAVAVAVAVVFCRVQRALL